VLSRPGILAGITMAIVVTAVAATGCGSEKATAKANGAHPQAGGANAHGASAEVASLLAGISQHGRTLGDPSAPVVVQFFGDLECPFCRQFALGRLNSLIQDYVRRGKLKIEYLSLETATHDPQTFQTQQVAAEAAGLQNRMWNYIELFYREQREENSGYVTEGFLQGLAQQVGGLNLIAWTAARSNGELAAAVVADERGALDAEIRKTPSFRIGQVGHPPYVSAVKKLLTG
jgi:protein-disulfide isomerase